MNNITKEEIGRRIADLRSQKGYTQDDLAKLMNTNRSTIAQIESGKRNINALELKQLANIFSISIDRLLSSDFDIDEVISDNQVNETKQQFRISVPEFNLNKFKNILLYILEKCAGKPNFGETVLYKILYFSDFNYYELYEEHLSGATYIKMPYGPVPKKLDEILKKMVENKQLKKINTGYYNYTQTKFIPLIEPDLSTFSAREKEIIDKVIEQYADWNASKISEYSHCDIPYVATKEGEVIDYELVFYREPPYSVRTYDDNDD
jgi:transcriptional regulator with XRE-family HTH domain